jgi:hypothetical protein
MGDISKRYEEIEIFIKAHDVDKSLDRHIERESIASPLTAQGGLGLSWEIQSPRGVTNSPRAIKRREEVIKN